MKLMKIQSFYILLQNSIKFSKEEFFQSASIRQAPLLEGTYITTYNQLHRTCLNLGVNISTRLLSELG